MSKRPMGPVYMEWLLENINFAFALSVGILPASFEELKSRMAVERIQEALERGVTGKLRNRKTTVDDVMWLVIRISLYRNRPMVDVAHNLGC